MWLSKFIVISQVIFSVVRKKIRNCPQCTPVTKREREGWKKEERGRREGGMEERIKTERGGREKELGHTLHMHTYLSFKGLLTYTSSCTANTSVM